MAQDVVALEREYGASPGEAIIVDDTDADNLRYRGESLVPVLVNSVKELSEENESLKNQLAALAARLDALENR